MIYEPSTIAVVIFFVFVGITLGISFWLGRKAQDSQGYFAAHGQIPWFVNGIAFAGDYLSAASFLGICGMIAFYGYDGFLYSIGYLAGWVVALFVVAEPMKRLGKFTFADALDAKFNSPGIKLAAGISTLAVSVFYLIPQMVGAGVLVQPLLGFDHWVGVVIVGVTVILIVVTAGMVSTTWVQFIKGSLLVVFSAILTVMILNRGFEVSTGEEATGLRTLSLPDDVLPAPGTGWELIEPSGPWIGTDFIRLQDAAGKVSVWTKHESNTMAGRQSFLLEAQALTETADDRILVNGEQKGSKKGEAELHAIGHVSKLPDGYEPGTPVGPLEFFSTLQESEVVLWGSKLLIEEDGSKTTVYFQKPTPGSQVLRPGEHPRFQGIRSAKFFDKLNFLSLMLALFCGTASLPHILIRYYTVKDAAAARKSTIVGIATIGFFYVLTLYLGLGAMTSGAMDVTDSNMAAPLLARSMSEWLFAAISAIAFTTVLGTVSGLILASAGAVTHDILTSYFKIEMDDSKKVRVAKIASVVVGTIAIVLGILFEGLNVSFLVGWAFSVAASANLPSLIMILFWKGVTKEGVISAVVVGMVSSLTWILLSADSMSKVFGFVGHEGFVPFGQPGIVTIPLGFLTLVTVSKMTAKEVAAT
ncbi:MAG: cation acetate symporter [Planctomycetota bacterium]|nr:cation acetate symporter [Planctomycetota bacterium]MDA1249889.1 cation acetate symporter [Planctomycetota bacterium]